MDSGSAAVWPVAFTGHGVVTAVPRRGSGAAPLQAQVIRIETAAIVRKGVDDISNERITSQSPKVLA